MNFKRLRLKDRWMGTGIPLCSHPPHEHLFHEKERRTATTAFACVYHGIFVSVYLSASAFEEAPGCYYRPEMVHHNASLDGAWFSVIAVANVINVGVFPVCLAFRFLMPSYWCEEALNAVNKHFLHGVSPVVIFLLP